MSQAYIILKLLLRKSENVRLQLCTVYGMDDHIMYKPLNANFDTMMPKAELLTL